MNDDIRGTLARALPDDLPAPRIDMDTVEQDGERLARRRRVGFAGLATAGVAVLAAMVAVPLAVMGPAGGSTLEAASGDQPEFPVPKLDSKYDYIWGTDYQKPYQETAETRLLTKAFWGHLSEKFPDLEVIDEGDPDDGGWDPDDPEYVDPEKYPAVTRSLYNFVHPEGAPTFDYRKPAYSTGTIGNRFGDITTSLDADRRVYDGLTVEVHPKGSYIADAKSTAELGMGPKVPYLVEGCEDGLGSGNGYDYDFTCAETTGPGGETVKTVRLVIKKDDQVWSVANSVIVTLENGNAVVARDVIAPDAIKGDDGDITDEEMEPELDFDELTELALALPDAVVE